MEAASFSAKIDGTVVNFPVTGYTQTGGRTVIYGTSSTGKSITLNLNAGTAATYTIGGATVYATYYNTATTAMATSGQIVISKAENNKVSGTFNFVITGGATVTEGVFTAIPLQ